jgi:hypothetical protein
MYPRIKTGTILCNYRAIESLITSRSYMRSQSREIVIIFDR